MDLSNNQPIQQQGAPRRAAVDWSSLPGDVVNIIAGYFLATDDLDYYMDFRAVCHNWRADTAGADPRAHPADPRFLLRQWVFLDEQRYPKSRGGSGSEDEETDYDEDDETAVDGLLFLNTTTGRYLRKQLPADLAADYYFITSTGGLLVLATRSSLHARLVNPLTASCVGSFMAPMPKYLRYTTAFVQLFNGGPSSLTLAVEDCDSVIHFARPDDEAFTRMEMHGMLSHVGMAWGITGEPEMIRGLMRSITAALKFDEMYFNGYHLLMSDGDMLLVIRRQHPNRAPGMDVLKVENNVVKPTRCIGGRALFIGQRCVSVDAAKFPSIDGSNCIFYHGGEFGTSIYMYDLVTDEEKLVTDDTIGLWRSPPFTIKSYPPSIIQVLMNYCTSPPWSQLASECYMAWDWCF